MTYQGDFGRGEEYIEDCPCYQGDQASCLVHGPTQGVSDVLSEAEVERASAVAHRYKELNEHPAYIWLFRLIADRRALASRCAEADAKIAEREAGVEIWEKTARRIADERNDLRHRCAQAEARLSDIPDDPEIEYIAEELDRRSDRIDWLMREINTLHYALSSIEDRIEEDSWGLQIAGASTVEWIKRHVASALSQHKQRAKGWR